MRETDLMTAPDWGRECRRDTDDPWHDAWYFESAYAWLARRTGFWPLFLAVGTQDDDRRLTGFQNQWSRSPHWGPEGPPKDLVLFSWAAPPAGAVHGCFWQWHAVLNGKRRGRGVAHGHEVQTDETTARAVLRPDLDHDAWRARATRNPGSVQAVAPMLDLPTADEIWAPNQRVARALERMGFDGVVVRRLRVGVDRA